MVLKKTLKTLCNSLKSLQNRRIFKKIAENGQNVLEATTYDKIIGCQFLKISHGSPVASSKMSLFIELNTMASQKLHESHLYVPHHFKCKQISEFIKMNRKKNSSNRF